MTNAENWLLHYNELKAHIIEHHRLPQKTVVEGRSKLHWWKYQQKKRKAGLLTEEQIRMLDELEQYRSREHTGGRRPKGLQSFMVHGLSLVQGCSASSMRAMLGV